MNEVNTVERPVMPVTAKEKAMGDDAAKDDVVFTALVMQCALAVLAGQETVTISTTGKQPTGFPRGELLSEGTNGARNYAVHPVKVLGWIHTRTSQRHKPLLSGSRRRSDAATC